ncbi:DUF2812 domain-containing protein [Sporosarcina sp. NPDC096371]|uniref:DUF2812 domain-containing protein n=1 Tax=Sporosarcina sp. NPDC096371 TaxID=3364530 RepID=UPI00380D4557
MTMKKWRPLWSYDVEKTESWLKEMAAKGNSLKDVNRMTRMFTFNRTTAEVAHFQVVYDKSQSAFPRKLEEAGWEETLSEKKWKFMKNKSEEISIFPSREGVLKRNRIHFYVLTGLAFFYVMPLIMMIITLTMILRGIGTVEPSPFWSVTVVYFLQILIVMGLAIFINKKLRGFEKKFFGGAVDVDVKESVGDTFTKWKFGWMHAPDILESWLAEMAAEGNHLVRIGKPGFRFVFEKGEPKRMSYVFDYQLKTSPSYFDVHKSAGWQLRYTSPSSFTKYSLWAQPYEEGAEIPRFTYDPAEKKAQVRKVVLSATVLELYIFVIAFIFIRLNYSMYLEDSWNMFNKVIFIAFIISLSSPLLIMIRTLKYAFRMRKK